MRSAFGIVSKVFLPLVAAGLATGISLLSRTFADITFFQSVLVGICAFCILMTLAVYAWLVRHVRSVNRQMNEFNTFENNILSRLQRMENGAGQTEKNLTIRLDDLEESVKASVTGTATAQQNTAISTSRAEFDPTMASKDGNVVALNPTVKTMPSASANSDNDAKRKSKAPSIQPSLSATVMSIRLQPILNLIDRDIIGLEAFAFFRFGDDLLDGRNFVDRLTNAQRTQYDLWVVQALSAVIREMHQDGQAIPIHYGLMSLSAPTDANWVKLTQTLRSDARLVENLVPVIAQKDFLTTAGNTMDKLLDLREAGLDCCLGSINDINGALEKETLKHFRQFKINAGTLLNYRADERERFADKLLPGLLKAEASIFVDEIREAFQASQLIDLDLVAGQGDYISKPKPIRLYKDIEENLLPEIADGTSDQTSK